MRNLIFFISMTLASVAAFADGPVSVTIDNQGTTYSVVNLLNTSNKNVRVELYITNCVNVNPCGAAVKVTLAPGMNWIQQVSVASMSSGPFSFNTRYTWQYIN